MGDILSALNGAQGQVSPPQGKTNFSYDPQQMQQMEQGGLQAPNIDPVYFGALGSVFGPAAAAKQLGAQVVQNQLLGFLGDKFKQSSQYAPVAREEDLRDLGMATKMVTRDPITDAPQFRDMLGNQDYGSALKRYYLASRYGTTVPGVEKLYSPEYGDAWDKLIYKAGDIMSKMSKAGVLEEP